MHSNGNTHCQLFFLLVYNTKKMLYNICKYKWKTVIKMRTIAILKDCKDSEKDLILSAAHADDRVLFFSDDISLLQSKYAKDVDIIFGEPDIATITALKNLRWIQMTWAGANKYTSCLDYPKHIKLTNASGAFGGVISEHIIAGVLALYKNLRAYQAQLKEGDWQLLDGDDSLEGKRALILGVGDIGSHTAKKLKAFGASTVGIGRTHRETLPFFDEFLGISELDIQLAKADLVIIALPGTPETKGLMNRERIQKMNSNAVFVNVGRGFVADTEALTQALVDKKIKGAVLDVTDPEPLPKDHKLRYMENVVLTPHVSGISWGENDFTRQKIISIFADNLQRDAQNMPLNKQIDFSTGY